MTTINGAGYDRIDGTEKVTGSVPYSADVHLAGLLHAVFATSTIANGRISRIDVGRAERVAGVVAVFTYKTMPRLAVPPLYAFAKQTGMTFAFLQNDRILYAGQPIAMVVANTREQAVGAAELIDVEYADEPPVATLADAASNAYELQRLYGLLPASYTRGNVEAGLRQADICITATYSSPGYRHHPIELTSTTVVWDGPKLTVFETTQGVSTTQMNLCDRLGLAPENVRVVSRFLGGGFGVKGMFWMHTAMTALAARELGRPLKLVITRDQMSATLGHREEQSQEMTLGATRDGKLTAIRHHKLSATSIVDDWVEPSCTASTLLYTCDNVATGYRLARTNSMTPTFMRGVGHSTGLFALESAMDELAYQLEMDPLDLRLRNYAEVDPRSGDPWTSKSLRECYRLGADMIGWRDRNPAVGAVREDGWLIGYGMGTALYGMTPRDRTEVRLRLYASGRVRVECGGQDLGTGTYTVAALVVGDLLGIPIDGVEVELGDTGSDMRATALARRTQPLSVPRAIWRLRHWLVALRRCLLATRSPHCTGPTLTQSGHVTHGLCILTSERTNSPTSSTALRFRIWM